MNATLKSILIYSAKNAVNAALLTLAPIFHDPEHYNWHNLRGLEHLGVMLAWAVIIREGMVWGPKILKWSQTPATGIVSLVCLAIGLTLS